MHIVVLSAFQDELINIIPMFKDVKNTTVANCRCWVTKWNGHDITLGLTGIGTIASAITTTILCERIKPDLIIFCGVAGGLKADQEIGDLVLANKIIDADLHLLPAILNNTPYKNALIDPHTLKPITTEYTVHPYLHGIMSSFRFNQLTVGTVVTSNTFPAPKSLFAEIKNLNCSAIEMESAGVFKAAEYYDVPVIALRAISNLLDTDGNDLGTRPDALTICAEKLASCLTSILNRTHDLETIADFNQQKAISSLITRHNLAQHPEGGWYRRTFQSNDRVKAEGNSLTRYAGESRTAGTSIIYLIPQDDFSAWHTVHSDETWSFHAGDPLLLRIINPANGVLTEIRLGHEEEYLQFTVEAGHVFSAESEGRFSLMGCIVTPGFDFRDFKLLTQDEFITLYPQHVGLTRLVRNNPIVPMVEDLAANTYQQKFF